MADTVDMIRIGTETGSPTRWLASAFRTRPDPASCADEQQKHERGGREVQRRGEGEEGGEPAGAVEEVAIGGTGGARGVDGSPIQLVNKHGAKLPTILVVPNVRRS